MKMQKNSGSDSKLRLGFRIETFGNINSFLWKLQWYMKFQAR